MEGISVVPNCGDWGELRLHKLDGNLNSCQLPSSSFLIPFHDLTSSKFTSQYHPAIAVKKPIMPVKTSTLAQDPNARKSRSFSISVSSSTESDTSRESSPVSPRRETPSHLRNGVNLVVKDEGQVPGSHAAQDIYDAALPWWRAKLRRGLVKSIRWESIVIAKMQVSRSRFIPECMPFVPFTQSRWRNLLASLNVEE